MRKILIIALLFASLIPLSGMAAGMSAEMTAMSSSASSGRHEPCGHSDQKDQPVAGCLTHCLSAGGIISNIFRISPPPDRGVISFLVVCAALVLGVLGVGFNRVTASIYKMLLKNRLSCVILRN